MWCARHMRPFVRVGEAIYVEYPFGLHLQPLARGDQHLELRRVRQDVGDQVSAAFVPAVRKLVERQAGVKEMLEVVEHEQYVAPAQVAGEVGSRVRVGGERGL